MALLAVITLSIYYFFWYYWVNREMADYGETHQTDIGMSPGMGFQSVSGPPAAEPAFRIGANAFPS